MSLKPFAFMLVLLSAVSAARCGSSSTTLLSPIDPRCGMTLATPSLTIAGAAGGSGSLAITTARECQWTASTSSPWIQLTSSSGQGPGTLSYDITPNRSTTERSGLVTVGDVSTPITQQAANCAWSMSPTALTTGRDGGDLSVSLSSEDFCSWSTVSQAPWIAVAPPMGTGNATIQLTVDANSGAVRRGVVTVGGISVTVDQAAALVERPLCGVDVSPAISVVSATGSSVTTTVTAATGCAWTASSNAVWIRLPANRTGSGSRSMSLTVDPNPGAARTGTVSVSGATLTITQDGAAPGPAPQPIPGPAPLPGPSACTLAVTPGSFTDVVSTASTVDVSVRGGVGCSWTTSSTLGWITIAQGATGTGDGTVRLSIQENTGAPRSGSVSIAGYTIVVSQRATSVTCSYSISPTSLSTVPAAGGSATVAVTTTTGCEWVVTGNPEWVTAGPAAGAGSSTTTIITQANTGAARSTTFQVAERTLTVEQLAAFVVCTYTVAPTVMNLSGSGPPTQTQTITVTTQPGCTVGATTNASWIQIASVPATGGGAIVIRVERNRDAARTGIVTVSGVSFSRTVTVNQDGRD